MGRFIRAGPGRLASERGQISIPALFVLPSLFLFVFLLYETGKLSREKIRHQFAADAAASVEMSIFSDYLNRTAHVNGAFPERLFREAFWDFCVEPKKGSPKREHACQLKSGGQGDRLYEIVWKNGAFPRFCKSDGNCEDVESPEGEFIEGQPVSEPLPDQDPKWFVRFGGCGERKNQAKTPDENASCTKPFTNTLDLLTPEDANDYWLTWDDAQQVYQLYTQAYHLLGSVQESQFDIYDAARKEQRLYRKSYQLNSGAMNSEWEAGAGAFPDDAFGKKDYCLKRMMISGTRPTKNPFMPYQVYKPAAPVEFDDTESVKGCGGLYQFTTVEPEHIRRLARAGTDSGVIGETWPGLSVFQNWDKERRILTDNYFDVDFSREVVCPGGGSGPCVHASVSLGNPALTDSDEQNGIWPDPTPKFQVRLSP